MAALTEELEGRRKSAMHAKQIAWLEKEVDRLEKSLHAARKSRVKLPMGKPRKPSSGQFTRVIVPDSHGCYIDHAACKAFLADLEQLRPAEVVLLGDHLDCGGWLAQHHTLGFVPEGAYTFEDDLNMCNQFLDAIQHRVGIAKTWYLEGNHEQRIRKTILKLCLGNATDSAGMLERWGVPKLLGLADRKIEWIDSGEVYGAEVHRTGVLKLGKCLFTHGRACGVNAAQKTLSQFKTNVCFGHTHRIQTATQESAYEPTLAAWSFGCLCRRVPLYYDTRPTDWSHGYGVQIVEPGGWFFTIQVPIIEGRSLLQQLALELRAA